MDLLVLAKEPVAGRVKTRLSPPCSPATAAEIAAAALADTLVAAMATGADRVVLALDGEVGPWCPPGVVVLSQGDGTFSDRLARAWRGVRGPALQIGMDTPQLGSAELVGAMGRLADQDCDAVLGPAEDGGWWAVGFRQPCPDAFTGVPMSRADTGAHQLARLEALGLRTALLPTARDVDTWEDALAIAELAPHGAFAAAVRAAVAR